jgi:hypothetical protein
VENTYKIHLPQWFPDVLLCKVNHVSDYSFPLNRSSLYSQFNFTELFFILLIFSDSVEIVSIISRFRFLSLLKIDFYFNLLIKKNLWRVKIKQWKNEIFLYWMDDSSVLVMIQVRRWIRHSITVELSAFRSRWKLRILWVKKHRKARPEGAAYRVGRRERSAGQSFFC